MSDQLGSASPPPTLPPEPEWRPSWERPEARRFLNRHLGTVLAGVAAVAVLFWLGWRPFRVGETSGALDAALAAMGNADSVHLTVQDPGVRRAGRMEAWATSDGFWRVEGWSGGTLKTLWLRTSDWEVVYDAAPRTEIITPMPGSLVTEPDLARVGGPVMAKLGVFLEAMQEMEPQEWRVRSLLRGRWNVIEAEGHASAELSARGLPYVEGELAKLRLETDEQTGLPRSLTLSKMGRGRWVTVSTAGLEWDGELPAAAYAFKPPKGTKIVSDTWWGEYADRTLDTGATQDWRVVLHTITTNADGDVFLTLSRQSLDQGRMERDTEVLMKTEATDEAGADYRQESCHESVPGLWGGYFRVILRRERGAPPAMAVDLTVRPYPEGGNADQSVTFERIPLPVPVEESEG